MATEDLKTLAQIGVAIWGDSEFSQRATLETYAAVSLLELPADRTVERAVSSLVDRAERDGDAELTRRSLSRRDEAFFHLPFDERILLVALHLGRWSYGRIARIFDEKPEAIESRAWTARMRIITLAPTLKRNAVPVWPSGPSFKGPCCPEYDSNRPWTQRFLDEEIASGADRLFLQNHLMACDSCRNVLNRCREVYFAVDALIPREPKAAEQAMRLDRASQTSRSMRRELWAPGFIASLRIFFRRPDILAVSVITVLLLLWGLSR